MRREVRLAISLKGIPARVVYMRLARIIHIIQVLLATRQNRKGAGGLRAFVAHYEHAGAFSDPTLGSWRCRNQPLAQQLKAGNARTRLLDDSSKLMPGTFSPSTITGSLNLSCIENSFMS